MANQTTLERKIEAVRTALSAASFHGIEDKAIALFLIDSGVTRYYPTTDKYGLRLTNRDILAPDAYAWCVANGLQAEADAFNARRQQAYTERNRIALLDIRRSLLERLAANTAALVANGYKFGEGE